MINPPSTKTMFGHPSGLFLLFGTELWERFSYYTMRAILTLYIADKAQGLGWSGAEAIELYATFTMFVYLSPLVGGWLADNYIGQRRSILIGGALMAAGQFTLAVPASWFSLPHETVFYIGLVLLIAGNGMFKPNISTMVGDLYQEGDHRRDGAFTIFYMGINVGAALAGIIAGLVYNVFGYNEVVEGTEVFVRNYKATFAAAGIGMVLSLIIQALFAQKLLGDIGRKPSAKISKGMETETRTKALTKEEFDRIKVIMILGIFTVIFWAGFEQAGGLLNIYADRFTDRTIGAFEVPTTFFQSLNPIFIVLCAPIIAVLWTRMGDKEPTSPIKFALGLILLAVGFVFMIGATLQQGGDTSVKTSMMWLVGAYFFHTIGELCLSPIGLSMVTKLSPLRLASVLMGVWFGFTGVANKVAGIVGAMIGHGNEAQMVDNALAIFAGIAITTSISGVILYFMADKLVYWMHGAEGVHVESVDKALEEELEVTAEHEAMRQER